MSQASEETFKKISALLNFGTCNFPLCNFLFVLRTNDGTDSSLILPALVIQMLDFFPKNLQHRRLSYNAIKRDPYCHIELIYFE